MRLLNYVLVISLLVTASQAHDTNVRVIRSQPTNTPTVDGILEADWWAVVPQTDFIQREPDEGTPATERTDVRVMHSPTNLYVAFRCYQEDLDKIDSKLYKRDELWSSDHVTIWLDTYHDHRNAFVFSTNPHGVKMEGNFYNDTREEYEWDGYWEVATTQDDSGWVAEFSIPFSTLRFKATEGEQTWGFNALRYLVHNKEMSYWQPVAREKRERISELGHLEGLSGITPGRGLEFRPYAVANFEEEGPSHLQGDNGWENLGLDVKYRLTTNLTLDATVNPDFAQIEADNEVINLSDYPVYLSEKRPFFMEGASIFNTYVELFYSRRITNPEAGAKISGKVGGTQVAAITARNLNEDDEHEDFGVFRLKRDIFNNSMVGMLLTDKEGPGEDWARVWSIDTQLRFSDPMRLEAQIAQSYKPGLTKANWCYYFEYIYVTDRFSGSSWFYGKGKDFRGNDAGWIGYTDYNRNGGWFQYAPRPEKWGIRRIWNNWNGGLEWQVDNRYAEKWWNYNNSIETMNYWYFGGGIAYSDYWRRNYVDDDEDPPEPYKYSDNFGNFNVENYDGWEYWIWFETDFTKPIAFDIGHSQGDFRDGYEKEVWGGFQLRPRDNLTLRFYNDFNRIAGVTDIEDGATTDFIVSRLKMEWTFSLNLFTRVNIQYVHEDGSYLTNALIGYQFSPESFMYLVYDDDRSKLLGWDTVNDRKIKAKVSYFFQL